MSGSSLPTGRNPIHLSIRDDGRGFDPDAILGDGTPHLACRSLRVRSKRLNAPLKISSRPGQGTIIELTVPLTATPTAIPKTDECHQ